MAYRMTEGRVFHDSGKFLIKEASLHEKEELHNIFRELLPTQWVDDFSWKKVILVAVHKEANNRVIGGIERSISPDKQFAAGAGFAVLPEFRRHGIGAKLIEEMDKELKKMGVEKIITAPREASWRLFRESGYEWDPLTKAYFKSTGEEEKLIKDATLEKRL